MKFVLTNLKTGDSLSLKIQEILSERELLISFKGDLLRVQNETQRALKAGDSVTVIVTATQPLRFRLKTADRSNYKHGRFDVSI